MSGRLADKLLELEPTQQLRFPLAVWPLAELLLTAHAARFTGRVVLRPGGRPGRGIPPGADAVFFREGSLVGVERPGPRGTRGLAEVLVEEDELEPAEAEAFLGGAKGVADLARQLDERGLVARWVLDRAVAEHARRRLFERAGDEASMVEVRAGIEALASFHPVYIDPRPAIAFGLVVHGRSSDKEAIMKRLAGRRVGLVVPYDAHRNLYGLPPPLLAAAEALSGGLSFDRPPRFGGLSWSDSAGLLLLLERIGLLELEDEAGEPRVPTSSPG